MTATCDDAAAYVRTMRLSNIAGILLDAAKRVDHFDLECDRALSEVFRLSAWIEARAARNLEAAL